jgi:hypothetical protein
VVGSQGQITNRALPGHCGLRTAATRHQRRHLLPSPQPLADQGPGLQFGPLPLPIDD